MATVIWTGGGDGITWSSTANWSTGSVPANSDNVYFLTGSNTITAGLAQSAVTLTSLTFGPNWSGQVGVAGPTGASLAIGCPLVTCAASLSGANGNSSGVFGNGGLTLFKWDPGSSTAYTLVVQGTGASADPFGSAVQVFDGKSSGNNIYVSGGTLDVAMVPGQSAAVDSISVTGGGTVNCGPGLTCPLFTQNGTSTNLLVGAATTTLTNISGNLFTQGTGLIATTTIGGTAVLNHRTASGNSLTTLIIETNGSANFSQNPAGLVIANPIQMYRDSSLTAFSKGQIQLAGSPSPTAMEIIAEGCGIGDLTIQLGTQGQTLTIA